MRSISIISYIFSFTYLILYSYLNTIISAFGIIAILILLGLFIFLTFKLLKKILFVAPLFVIVINSILLFFYIELIWIILLNLLMGFFYVRLNYKYSKS